jgi:general secretion pathway protein G
MSRQAPPAHSRPRASGFTLIELLVTLAILALLATVTLPVAQVELQRHKERELKVALRDIRTAIDAYKLAYEQGRIAHSVGASGYPPTLEILVEGVEDARDPKKRKIYFLRRIPDDPMSGPTSTTWATRCYASDADDPQQGDDVYDVHTRTPAVSIDGTPYRRW